MHGFVGRERELAALRRMVERVAAGGRAGRPGRALLVRGRRRVGKSRLVEEFLDRSGLPHVYFTASALTSVAADLEMFVEAGRTSSLPDADRFTGQAPRTWDAALSLLSSAVPADRPSVVVLDELPYLVANDPAWKALSRRSSTGSCRAARCCSSASVRTSR
ncbi:MAG: ATP-binding protein [Actinomycetales bacterium]